MGTRRRTALAAAVTIAVALPGCAPGRGATIDVAVRNIAYAPASVDVPVNASVVWTNDDAGVRHTVTSGKPGDVGVPGVAEPTPSQPDGTFDGSLDKRGSAFTFRFTERGSYDYFCVVHPSMTGVVVVR